MNDYKQRPQSDEIDLAHFFSGIGRAFSNLGTSMVSGMANLRNTFYRNRIFFVGIIILGLLLGVLYSEVLKKDFYKSSMVLSCDYLNTQILENTIEKFDMLADERDGEGLEAILGIEMKQAQNIHGFSFRPFVSEDDVVEIEVLREQLNNVAAEKRDLVEKVISKLEIENKNAYEISVLVYDPEIVKPLETALVNYFKENDYIRRRIESNRQRLQERQQKLRAELRQLDSLKGVVFKNYQSMAEKGRGSNNVVVGDETLTNPIEIFTKDLSLHQELQDVEEKLYLGTDFEVVDGFTSFKEPESASLPDVLAISLLLSILIGYLVLGAYRLDRILAEYPTKHQVLADLTTLLRKEFVLELRRKSVISGIALYMVSLIFICYLTFSLRRNAINEATQSALFWLVILFSVVNTVAKSFIGEKKGVAIYYYSIASPQKIIISKIVYNTLLCFILSLAGYALFHLFIDNPVQNHTLFLLTLALTSIGFSAALTLISGIASRANNSNILMAVLSFPILISILLMAIRVTKNVLDGIDPSASYDELLNLVAINGILLTLAFLLFPYIWRS